MIFAALHHPISILDIGSVGFDQQRSAIGIDQGMSLAPFDLLASVIAPRAAAFRGLDALTVDNGCARAGLAPRPVAVSHHQSMVHSLKYGLVA